MKTTKASAHALAFVVFIYTGNGAVNYPYNPEAMPKWHMQPAITAKETLSIQM